MNLEKHGGWRGAEGKGTRASVDNAQRWARCPQEPTGGEAAGQAENTLATVPTPPSW